MNDLTIDLISTALDIAQEKHGIATHNIAAHKVSGEKLTDSFDQVLAQLATLDKTDLSIALKEIDLNWNKVKETHISTSKESTKLDDEVSQTLLASGKYKVLAEALNRKLGMMNLVVSSRGK